MSSHQRRAGTAKCIVPAVVGGDAGSTSSVMFSPQHPHAEAICTACPSMMETPRASHAQLAYDSWRGVRTRNGVGTAENGGAIKISPLEGCKTSMRPAARRSSPPRTSDSDAADLALSSAIEGGVPRANTVSYT